ncbi:hypothetical protein [Bacillus xiapuensis]|uniref:hypothetical protein n=1 Tax=Bacillus xiapuensis TaxID=2014075 RepID=UPI000C24DD74|nr:hypothetical protein [Bacillus xiapuensis]
MTSQSLASKKIKPAVFSPCSKAWRRKHTGFLFTETFPAGKASKLNSISIETAVWIKQRLRLAIKL